MSAAEDTFVFNFVRLHNSCRDKHCRSGLMKIILPNSAVTKRSYVRTMIETVVNYVLAPHSVGNVLKSIEENEISY